MTDLNLTPPTVPAEPLVLTPPAPVVIVEKEQAAGAVAIPDARTSELAVRAGQFATELVTLDPKSPDFARKVQGITSLGDREMQASAQVSNRMLDRPAAALGKNGGDAQTRVAGTLAQLRTTVTDLDPNRADLKGARRVLSFLPGGDKIARYFEKYQSAQDHLNAIITALDSGQDELRKDNAAIETEKTNMWELMGKLGEYNALASALDEALVAKIAGLEASGRVDDANTVRSEALFPVRQRRQDIMTQLAVAVQGYLALDLVRKNNLELIRGVDRAKTTTVAALRTAVIVAQALSRQKLVLDQITALNTTTSNLIESTSQQLQQQGATINQQASAATIDVAKLEAAFNNVFATMDALDTFRAQAVDSMAQTVQALETQVTRARPYLERVHVAERN